MNFTDYWYCPRRSGVHGGGHGRWCNAIEHGVAAVKEEAASTILPERLAYQHVKTAIMNGNERAADYWMRVTEAL